MVGVDDVPVWPSVDGDVRGPSFEPLYARVPAAVRADGELHETLALIDSLRVGRVRDREFAAAQLQRRLG